MNPDHLSGVANALGVVPIDLRLVNLANVANLKHETILYTESVRNPELQ